MEPSTKKGLIIGGSIAAVVLIGASIGIGIAVSGNGSSNGIQVWGYNDQVSSTALKVNKYMGLTFEEEANYWGEGFAASAEGTLLRNENYHSVNDDAEILDGVNGADQGLGYLSSTWVSGYKDDKGNGDQFTMLKLYDNGVVNGEAPATWPDRTDASNYIDPNGTDADKEAYTLVNSVADTFTATATDEDGNLVEYSVYSEEMQATLNTTMKVTPEIANWLRPTMGTATALDVSTDTTGTAAEFVTWTNEKGYTDDFVVAYGLFNYMAYDSSNITNINSMALHGTNSTGRGELENGWYDTVMEASYKNLTGKDGTLLDAILAQQANESGSYAIKVDGTGTNSGIMKQEISNFQEDVKTATKNDKIVFRYDLDNGGSGEAWALPKEDIGTILEGDQTSGGRADAFIGTSSRKSKTKEIANFGYEAVDASIPNGGSGDVYVSPDTSDSGQILGYTMGIDLPVFFVNKGMQFEYTVTETSLPCIENATEKGIKVGDTINVTPTGMSDMGGKAIYEDAATWTEVLDLGLILVQAV